MTGRLTVAADGSHLLEGGSPWVLVADTAWSAFADAGLDEWRAYVRRRAEQGFNTVLVSVLPILHDRAVRADAREPFAVDPDGHYRFDQPDGDYFSRAVEMTRIAADGGLRLALVVLWCNYVPGTWGAERTPWAVMPEPLRNEYLELVVARFAGFDPILVISGDEHFHEDEPTRVYGDALARVKRIAPECLTTLHSTPDADLPPELADSPLLDLYSYQAGHDLQRQDRAWQLAELYRSKSVRRPVVDLEPCYEGHGYGAGAGRFRASHVRSATWWSITGGAAAGIGYGAHGVWQWYRPGARFTNPGFSLEPFPFDVAMGFPGAADVGFAGALVRDTALYRASARQDLLVDPFPGLRACASDDLGVLAVYLPDARDVALDTDLDGSRVVLWDLASRTRLHPRLRASGAATVLAQPDTLGDLLLIAER